LWDAQIETMDGGRVQRVMVLCDEAPVSYAETI